MKLTYLGMLKHPDGIYKVTVQVKGLHQKERRYTYEIASDFAFRRFLYFYRRQYFGKALNILKKFNLKENS